MDVVRAIASESIITQNPRANGVKEFNKAKEIEIIIDEKQNNIIYKTGTRTAVFKFQRLECAIHYFIKILISKYISIGKFILHQQNVSTKQPLQIQSDVRGRSGEELFVLNIQLRKLIQ